MIAYVVLDRAVRIDNTNSVGRSRIRSSVSQAWERAIKDSYEFNRSSEANTRATKRLIVLDLERVS